LSLLQSIILGIVQGLTEFLPISSSAHLLMIPWLFGWQPVPFVFDTSLHLGTLVAILIYFRKDLINLLFSFFRVLKTRDLKNDQDGKLAVGIFIGTIPAGLLGLLFEDFIEAKFHTPYVIATTLIVLGIILWLADKKSKKTKTLNQIGIKEAVLIGCAQALALIPGTSRSGITMTASLFADFDRETSARFSFLLATPITLVAGLYKLKDLFGVPMTTDMKINFIVGFIVSAVSGYLFIKYLIKFLQKNTFTGFAVYRVVIGIVLLICASHIGSQFLVK